MIRVLVTNISWMSKRLEGMRITGREHSFRLRRVEGQALL